MKPISVSLVSGAIPKDFSTSYSSFVFDEAYRLAKRGLNIHATRCFSEKESTSFGIYYHGLDSYLKFKYIPLLIKRYNLFYKTGYFLDPSQVVFLSNYAQTVANVTCKQNLRLIHAHFAYPEGFVGFLAKKENKRPLVVTVHGVDILVDPSINYGVRLNRKIDATVKRVLNNADAVIAASTATLNEVHNIVEDDEKIHFIPNGVDLQRFNSNINFTYLREKLGLGKGIVIFTLRSHESVYGLEYFIKAASIVLKHRSDVFFVVGGDGSLKKYHEKLAEELCLSKKMIFTGRISRDEVPYYYCLSDVVVVPSLQEAFGITVSEAMACGKPVIGSNLGGIRDQIIDSHTGFLIEPRNPSKIAEKILLLAENPEEAKRMGLNGRRLVEEKFDIEKRIDRIISVYNKVLMQ